MCINYRKLNQATRKDNFVVPFVDQTLERLARQPCYCFLDGYSEYNQITVNPLDQEKPTFTCSFEIFTYRKRTFGLCNALATFQRCTLSIFSYLIEKSIEVFMDDFFVLVHHFTISLKTIMWF